MVYADIHNNILDIPKSRRTKEPKMAGYAQTLTNSYLRAFVRTLRK